PPAPKERAMDYGHDHGHVEDDDEHDRGLAYDLSTLFDRRRTLKLLAGAGASLFAFTACGSDKNSAASGGTSSTAAAAGSSTTGATTGGTTATTATSGTVSAADCKTIPSETAGPYPGDGSNGPNVL